MTTYVVDPKDLGKFERRFAANLRLQVAGELRRLRPRVVGLLQQKSEHINDMGRFRRAWRAEAKLLELRVWNDALHALFVEGSARTDPYARRPNRRMPPLQVIREWLERRGLDPKLAFVVARAIGRRGIKARPVLRAPETQNEIGDMVHGAAVHARDAALRGAR